MEQTRGLFSAYFANENIWGLLEACPWGKRVRGAFGS